jgi:alpha-L-fucosidase
MWRTTLFMLAILAGVTAMVQAAGKGPKTGWESPAEKAKVKALVSKVNAGIAKGPFKATLESLKRYQAPDWYRDAKFGIFIHWGLYSVPAYNNEWYSRLMYQKDTDEFKHHIATFGPQDKYGYKNFIPLLTADRYDADHWAELFKMAGAKYVVPVAEHHDGFAMYDTSLSRWSAKKMGPKRDLIGELAQAVRTKGLVFGLSTHRAEHWWFMNGGMKFPSDVQNPAYADFYGPAQPDGTPPDAEFLSNWLARCAELVDKYHPQVMGDFDWWIGEQPAFDPFIQKLKAYYYNQAARRKEGVVLTAKVKTFIPGTSLEDVEKGQISDINPVAWQTDTSISWRSWAYLKDDPRYKDAGYLIRYLINTVSKNGNLLLNISPKPDGTIPEEQEKILLQIGAWLKVNGEAIYGTRPWTTFGEGPTQEKGGSFQEASVTYRDGDVRYTRKGDGLYAISLVAPKKPIALGMLGRKESPSLEVLSVEQIGSNAKVEWKRDGKALVLRPAKTEGDLPVVFKLTLSGTKLGRLHLDAASTSVTVTAELQNYGKQSFASEATLTLDGKETSATPVTVRAQSSLEIGLVYKSEKPGVFRLGVACDGETIPGLLATLPSIDLTGTWLFNKGDQDAWKKMSASEDGWEKVMIPDTWENHSKYMGDHVYGWYRKHFTVPAEWKGHDLKLPMGKIDDCDTTYVNGQKVGSGGKFPPDFQTAWSDLRHYIVPAKVVNFGGDNVVAIRVYNHTGDGGLYSGPLGPVEAIQKP